MAHDRPASLGCVSGGVCEAAPEALQAVALIQALQAVALAPFLIFYMYNHILEWARAFHARSFVALS